MRAAFHLEQGGVDVLRVGTLSDPLLDPDDVIIRAAASSLDRVDLYFRTGANGMRLASGVAHIGGRDVAGVISAVGPSAASRYPQLVPGLPVVGVAVRSAHAELVAVPGALVFPLPAGCGFTEAAAIPTAGRTAYDGLMNRGRLSPGERVLVIAGSSGVGSFGLQIAVAAGASVLTTVGASWKADPARSLGASEIIDHYTEDVAARVRELTAGEGVDVVLDPVGAATFPAAMRSLRREGRYVTTGVTAGHHADIHLGKVFERGLTVTGVGRPSNERIRDVMQRLLTLVASGEVRPAVHTVLPLDQIAEGHRLLESSQVFGKIVIAIGR